MADWSRSVSTPVLKSVTLCKASTINDRYLRVTDFMTGSDVVVYSDRSHTQRYLKRTEQQLEIMLFSLSLSEV